VHALGALLLRATANGRAHLRATPEHTDSVTQLLHTTSDSSSTARTRMRVGRSVTALASLMAAKMAATSLSPLSTCKVCQPYAYGFGDKRSAADEHNELARERERACVNLHQSER